MLCTCFRTDPATLIAALTSTDTLVRYQEAVAEEIPGLADRAMLKHLRRMSTHVARALAGGFDSLARDDVAAADELLSDLVAVGTYRGWDLPLEPLGEREVAVEGSPRGLLGADRGAESARVWLIERSLLALSRSREAGDAADVSSHHRA
jgi:hypothetical protein